MVGLAGRGVLPVCGVRGKLKNTSAAAVCTTCGALLGPGVRCCFGGKNAHNRRQRMSSCVAPAASSGGGGDPIKSGRGKQASQTHTHVCVKRGCSSLLRNQTCFKRRAKAAAGDRNEEETERPKPTDANAFLCFLGGCTGLVTQLPPKHTVAHVLPLMGAERSTLIPSSPRSIPPPTNQRQTHLANSSALLPSSDESFLLRLLHHHRHNKIIRWGA